MKSNIKIAIINQLSDNYSYIIYSLNEKKALIVDPAESLTLINFLQEHNLSLQSILITHHHSDHTLGINELLLYKNIDVYSSNLKIARTTKLIKDKEIIDFGYIAFKVIASPGHTLDHVIFYNSTNNILFSGDTLFCLGCGRIFEGSYKQMFDSLQSIAKLPDKTNVYCGHEYTYQNYNFLNSIFPNHGPLNQYKKKIDSRFNNNECTIPFTLGDEKKVNPFLASDKTSFENYMKNNNFNKFNFFQYLRKLKDNF